MADTPLARRGRSLGLDLPTAYSGAAMTAAMLEAVMAYVAEHGTVRGVAGALSRWIAMTRNAAARSMSSTALHQAGRLPCADRQPQ